ncbi:MAG: hypothetical protein V2I50_02640, partial [Desulfuromusa sp.]|nr:hypothetical protein [Desulfuromusa sp.]
MKILDKNKIYSVALLLLLLSFTKLPVMAAQSGCTQAAENWILNLNDQKNAELFQRYAVTNCQFSGDWVKRSENLESQSHKERMCQDLVLLWSYKNC